MKEIICLDCEHVFLAPFAECCPECNSFKVDLLQTEVDWENGFFEGDMISREDDE